MNVYDKAPQLILSDLLGLYLFFGRLAEPGTRYRGKDALEFDTMVSKHQTIEAHPPSLCLIVVGKVSYDLQEKKETIFKCTIEAVSWQWPPVTE